MSGLSIPSVQTDKGVLMLVAIGAGAYILWQLSKAKDSITSTVSDSLAAIGNAARDVGAAVAAPGKAAASVVSAVRQTGTQDDPDVTIDYDAMGNVTGTHVSSPVDGQVATQQPTVNAPQIGQVPLDIYGADSDLYVARPQTASADNLGQVSGAW